MPSVDHDRRTDAGRDKNGTALEIKLEAIEIEKRRLENKHV